MAIKFTTENSNIQVNTFLDAPETADIDINIKGNATIIADTMLNIRSVDNLYTQLGISKDLVEPQHIAALIDKIAELKSENVKPSESSLLTWANTTAIFSTIASAEPLSACISGLLAIAMNSKNSLDNLKALFHR